MVPFSLDLKSSPAIGQFFRAMAYWISLLGRAVVVQPTCIQMCTIYVKYCRTLTHNLHVGYMYSMARGQRAAGRVDFNDLPCLLCTLCPRTNSVADLPHWCREICIQAYPTFCAHWNQGHLSESAYQGRAWEAHSIQLLLYIHLRSFFPQASASYSSTPQYMTELLKR